MVITTRFELHRRRLLGLAYRMLGSRADAEDLVQEAWLKWSQVQHDGIENDEAYLTTIITRLCLDKIKQERVRREAYIGQWLPEPITDAANLDSQTASEYADDLSYALLLALERLSPLERAAFLLHDVFDVPFSEIATTLERNESAVRQLAARARKSVREKKPSRAAPPDAHKKLLTAFLMALGEGDTNRLKTLLREDAVFISDGGGKKPSVSKPVQGAESIIRLLMGFIRQDASQGNSIAVIDAVINGSNGLLIFNDGTLEQTLMISVDGEYIDAIYAMRSPEKLARLALHELHSLQSIELGKGTAHE